MKWIVICFCLFAVCPAVAGESAVPSMDRLLLIAVDAVPFSLIAELTADADGSGPAPLFKELKGPVPLISTFPSFTTVAFSGILKPLGLAPAPGYEARFYDREEGRKRGGGICSYYRIPFPWRDFFDWKIHSFLLKGLGYLSPQRVTRHELRESFDAFAASEAQRFSIYIGNSDSVAHMFGEQGLRPLLVQLDARLGQFRAEHPDISFTTVMFSDHGMSDEGRLVNVRGDVKRALRRAGFKVVNSLSEPDAAVTVPLGLISNGAVFTSPGREAEAAAALCQVPAVDVCVWRTGDGWRVRNAQGTARICREVRQGQAWWAYVPLDADPLDYQPVLLALERRSGQGSGGYFPDHWWFEETAGHRYPDALYRLATSFDLVRNPASVVFSLKPGHMHGALTTKIGAVCAAGRLGGTHGALLAKPSLAFIMSDAAWWTPPRAVRYDQALAPFADEWARRAPAGSDGR